jgi:hypothetical protein
MKKTITLLFAFVLAISLNSCGGSDDSSSSSSADKIVGTWRYSGDIYNGVFDPEDYEACDDEFVKFASNNTGKYIEKYCGESDDVFAFSWQKTSDPLYNYVITDSETGETSNGIILFSADFKTITLYETEDDMLEEFGGEVYQKQ